MNLPEIHIRFPDWIGDFLEKSPVRFPKKEDRMRFVISLSRKNIENNTGGPFAAAVFDESGILIAPGLNLVVSSNCSIFHAEIVAIAFAQKVLGRYDISNCGMYTYELCTTTEPCAMCLGALHWSGARRLVCGARDADARSVGFDEGPKLPDWISPFKQRGISVECDVLRQEAAAVLNDYAAQGGPIYNPNFPVKKTEHTA
jgi:tRNA(Arg) A34 adenosine deaminase TadA